MKIRVGALAGLAASILAINGYCQHPVEIQQLANNGQYLAALSSYDKMPDRTKSVQAILAAAKSAWALGLPNRAQSEFAKLSDGAKVSDLEKARILLSRGIIDIQESRFESALTHAERATSILAHPSSLRGRAFLLWGESLVRLGKLELAKTKLEQAVLESIGDDQAEARYIAAQCFIKLAAPSKAREQLTRVPLDHDRAPASLKLLGELAFKEGAFAEAQLWLGRGRTDFPEEFLDSWVDYALGVSAMKLGERDKVFEILKKAESGYPPSDYWLTLLQSAVESFEWQNTTQNQR